MSLLTRRLNNFVSLPAADQQALLDAICHTRELESHEDLIREGEATGNANVILSGFACRHKTLPDGRRQIIGYLLPGDAANLHVCLSRRMDHSITALSAVKAGVVRGETATALAVRYPRLGRAFRWAALVDESVSREWLLNVGQRTALERLAHLLCEIFVRLRAVGLVDNDTCVLPVTQAELADTLALSTVHVNRTLQELRRQGLVSMRDRSLSIHDFNALQAMAMFRPDYLHLDGERSVAQDRRIPELR